MSDVRKNEQEHIVGFRRVFEEFPKGKLNKVSPPGPDFVLFGVGRIYGIEHTEYIRGRSKVGSDRQYDVKIQRIYEEAQKLFEERNDILLKVFIGLPSWFIMNDSSKINFKEFISKLVGRIEANIPEFLDVTKEKIYSHYSLKITRVNAHRKWWSQRGFIDEEPYKLQEILNDKDGHYLDYKKYCDKIGKNSIWLLIVADSKYISSYVSFPDLSEIRFDSCFDKVFFYDHSNKYYCPLRIKPRYFWRLWYKLLSLISRIYSWLLTAP